MADVDAGGGGGRGKKGGSKTKKKSTRIDMTAMVDVAFLLLTFFVLTATMSDSVVMQLTMPPKVDEKLKDELYIEIDEKKIMTIVLDSNDVVKYYVGALKSDKTEVKTTDYSDTGIRKALMEHINTGKQYGLSLCKEVDNAPGCWDPIFVVKPRKQSRYKNLVDILDEFAVTGAPKYAVDKFFPADSIGMEEAVKRAEAKAGQ
jgi:biopolymer transport protein ExbD